MDYETITGRRIRWRPDRVDPRTDTANDAPFTITIIDDDVDEDDEYLEVHFTVETTGYAFPSAIARVTILDDDGGKMSTSTPPFPRSRVILTFITLHNLLPHYNIREWVNSKSIFLEHPCASSQITCP